MTLRAATHDMTPRAARPQDLAPLTELWNSGWHVAHAAHVPADFAALRTPASFRARLEAFGDALRCAGPVGAPLGFCVAHGDHIDQLYTAAAARGTGLAQALIADGEARLAAAGIRTALLDCLPENSRAARFYTRCGWSPRGVETVELDTSRGPYRLPCLVFTKHIAGGGRSLDVGGGSCHNGNY